MPIVNALSNTCRQTSIFSSHHLELDLDAQGLLLNSSYPCGEGLPHASGPSQGQLGNTFKAGNGTGQDSCPTRSAHEQRADDLPVWETGLESKFHSSKTLSGNRPKTYTPCLLLGVLQEARSIGGGRILLGVVQPPTGIVLHPVSPVTVAQQEMISLFAPQEESVTWCKHRS